MRTTFYLKLLGLGILIFIAGCTTSPRMKKTKKPALNAVLQDKSFQEAFKTRDIKLVAPASGTEPEKIETLQTMANLKVNVPTNIISKDIIFHANSDEARFKLLKDALFDRSKNMVVWTLRGGYGSVRLLDKLKALPKPKQEKVFIGFSDNTTLHLFLSQYWNWKSIHGSGLAELLNPNRDPDNFKKIADIVSKKAAKAEINNLKPLNASAEKLNRVVGKLTGGNLAMIQSGIGTHWQIKSAGKILFLEDVGAKGYQVDRSLYHLRQAGIFKGVKGIVFGDFADSAEDVTLALERFAKETHIPVYKTDQFGHGKINYPLVYNARSEITSRHLMIKNEKLQNEENTPSDPTAKEYTLVMHLKD